ncbi:cell number regulator 1-like [Panicum virgatum]|uniref:Cell number regulator 1 n=1 Tax=Panicum virgatum TaxID=38727 RepID=A0A8T0XFS3_PANVG|nr:cell number regulator 1-like [Panicum virgatum]KAG2654239.1 hypothetical protein PVAP13_1NG488600 [Panicum virgatum]
MYSSPPPDAYNKFSAGAPPTAAPPAAYQQHGAVNMNPSRPGAALRTWSTGLFHCMDDPGNCLITCLCPCITFGQIADIVDKGTCSCIASGLIYGLICASTGMGCLYSCLYRSRLRAEYDLQEGECPDFLVHCCCEHLALCQEYRELKNRGYDLGIGWDANMDRQRRGVASGTVMGAPATPLGMIR